MDNEFETPTNVMGEQVLDELTARLRDQSVVVELEAPPEEPSKLIPLLPEPPSTPLEQSLQPA